MNDILIDAFMDSYPILPILFLTYLLFEYFERYNHLGQVKKFLAVKGLGPLIGAFLGILPQCGFSIAIAGLYLSHTVSIGTLVAVFIATSDEAIPILISYPSQLPALLFVIVGKLIIAFFAGYVIDLWFHSNPSKEVELTHSRCEHEHLFVVALRRTIKIFLFIFITNILVGSIIHMLGEERLSMVLMSNTIWQPLLAGLFGFIPNCAASVVLTQLFVNGSISFGSFCAGLITNAGLGMFVLLRNKEHRKDVFIIAAYVLAIAFLCGVILQMIW